MYLHEMEGGKPKAKLEARAKVNPALRPPSKHPVKPTTPVLNPTAKMLWDPLEEFDFLIYYDYQEYHQAPLGEIFYDCQDCDIKSQTLGILAQH